MEAEVASTRALFDEGILTEEECEAKVAEIRMGRKNAAKLVPSTMRRSEEEEEREENGLASARELLEEGILTQEEFDAQVAEIEAVATWPRGHYSKEANKKAKMSEAPAGKKKKKTTTTKKKTEDDLESLSAAALKSRCKDAGISGAGDKATVLWRLKLRQAVESEALTLDDDDDADDDDADEGAAKRSPFDLKGADLKRSAAKLGVSVMGSMDEILEGLVEALRRRRNKSLASAAAPSAEGHTEAQGAVEVARRILALADEGDSAGVLSLGAATPITALSPVAAMQRAYRKLALVVHPDKLRAAKFDGATRAFQALVTALDALIAGPEAQPDAQRRTTPRTTSQNPSIARSNEGCVRTRVACPRCAELWGSAVEGLPKHAYNWMMTGLRSFTCATCLCEFGCCAAKHSCAKCGASFEYSPLDYHRKVECTTCGDVFGFWMYSASDRATKEAVQEARRHRERVAKQRAATVRRSARADRSQKIDPRVTFTLGLVDECPRCGRFLEDGAADARRAHLASCETDAAAHVAHSQASAARHASAAQRGALEEAQEALQARATWEASGAKKAELWMLPDAALAQIAGLPRDAASTSEDRAALVRHAAASLDDDHDENAPRTKRLLLVADGAKEAKQQPKRRRLDAASMPADYAALPLDALRAVCAAQGFDAPPGASKQDLLDAIAADLDRHDDDDVKLLTGAATQPPAPPSDDDDDGDYGDSDGNDGDAA